MNKYTHGVTQTQWEQNGWNQTLNVLNWIHTFGQQNKHATEIRQKNNVYKILEEMEIKCRQFAFMDWTQRVLSSAHVINSDFICT